MNKQAFSDLLQNLIDTAAEMNDTDNVYIDGEWQDASTQTFEDIGLLTNNTGLVIRLNDGSRFYLTIQEAPNA